MSELQSRNSLRLRLGASLLLYISGYAPLLFMLVVQDFDLGALRSKHPVVSFGLVLIAGVSILTVLHAARSVTSGLVVDVVKTSNKSGDLFGYTIPYMLSFMKIDFGSWQVMVCLLIFFGMQFVIAYRTQTVFVNPVLAVAGYLLIDCTFKRDGKETQAMVLTSRPLVVGQTLKLERLSHYLYVAAQEEEGVS